MKKLFGLLKPKKEDGENGEEQKHTEEDHQDKELSTKDKDSTSNPDEFNREAKLEEIKRSMLERRVKKFDDVLSKKQIEIEKLRNLSWSGVPSVTPILRSETWKLLLDYLPIDQEIQQETIKRKREEYIDMVNHYFGSFDSATVNELCQLKAEMSQYEKKSIKQIKIDVYRTQPDIKLFASQFIQTMMIRILFMWSIRHPASGYVQGINDLAAPLIIVYLSEHVNEYNQENIYDIQDKDLEELEQQQLISAEADAFWCLSKLIDDIQDNYTENQPGVHKILNKMKKLIEQSDSEALDHLSNLDINFIDFAYRWVSCYLTREFNIYQIIRLWDTYFSEEDGFSQFHCYVCAALFLYFAKDLKQLNYQDALLFLQNLPTQTWNDDDLNILMAESYKMKELYHYNTHLYQS